MPSLHLNGNRFVGTGLALSVDNRDDVNRYNRPKKVDRKLNTFSIAKLSSTAKLLSMGNRGYIRDCMA